MTCRFAHDDAAYVLGALPPSERLAFERHLPGCEECTDAVRQLAGLPGLLGRIDPTVLEEAPDRGPVPEPLPETLLPALTRELHRSRRRRARTGAAVAAAAAVVAGVLVVTGLPDGPEPTRDAPPAAQPDPVPVARPMRPVGDSPVRARLTLEDVTWGTRLGLTCTYDADSVDFDLPPEVDYWLVVRTREGRTEQVGSWRSVDDLTMTLAAGTATDRADIDSVEVRAPGGRVVLRLRL